jgi:hypothetical protein
MYHRWRFDPSVDEEAAAVATFSTCNIIMAFFHDALKCHGELIPHFVWVVWRHSVCEEESKNVMEGLWNALKLWGYL